MAIKNIRLKIAVILIFVAKVNTLFIIEKNNFLLPAPPKTQWRPKKIMINLFSRS
jgi:hypothetical protein